MQSDEPIRLGRDTASMYACGIICTLLTHMHWQVRLVNFEFHNSSHDLTMLIG